MQGGARQGFSVHPSSLRKDSAQHQHLSIHPFPAPLAHVHPEHFAGQGRSVTKLQPITGKLHCHEIDHQPCLAHPLETTGVIPLVMRKLYLLPIPGEHQPYRLSHKSMASEAPWSYNQVGNSFKQELTVPCFCFQERVC